MGPFPTKFHMAFDMVPCDFETGIMIAVVLDVSQVHPNHLFHVTVPLVHQGQDDFHWHVVNQRRHLDI